MTYITITGTPNSQATELAAELAKRLHGAVGSNRYIEVSSLGWYHNPTAYSIFCMSGEMSSRDRYLWDCSRKENIDNVGIDIEDMRNYDLILNTDYYSISDVMDTILACYRHELYGALLCGRQVLPTKQAVEVSQDVYIDCVKTQKTIGTPIVSFNDFKWYVLDGHARMYGNLYIPFICHVKHGEIKYSDSLLETYKSMHIFEEMMKSERT